MDPKTNLITTLKEIKVCIEEGDVDKLKANIDLFLQDLERNKQELKELYKSGDQSATQTALILAACRSNQADILYYLLYETDILNHFSDADFDDKAVQTQRTEAFKLALIWDTFNMVDMLYDYWSGDLHWIGHDINKLTTLGKILKEAREICVVETQQLLIDIHSLIQFNDFQQKLYSSIINITPEKTAKMLVEVLRVYDEYSDEDKVRLPHEEEDTEQEQKTNLDDENSEFWRMQIYIKYIVYFRKLDVNVALLILDNWFILRGQFKDRFNQPEEYFAKNPPEIKNSYEKAVSLYKEIECTLFHFIYCTWDDWRIYLPRNRQITVEEHHTGIHKGKIIENLKIKYDKHTLNNGPVLFLERKNFSDRVKELTSLLEEHIISVASATNSVQNSIDILLDNNYLTPNMNMSDYYSLSKIVYYIKAIENTNDNDINVLMIARVLQVTGEMSKSTTESNHLSDSAKSLLQVAISVDTVKQLSNIRNFLSHAKKGQLRTRANIAETNCGLFHGIRKDLIIIKQRITAVLEICKKKFDKSLLEKGETLLDKKIEKLPPETLRHIHQCYKIHGSDLIDSETSKPLLRILSEKTSLTTQLLNEIIWILVNKDSILQKKELAKISIGKEIVSILPIYIQNMRQVLAAIDENNEKVNLINQELGKCKIKKELPNDPNNDSITKMRRKLQEKQKKLQEKQKKLQEKQKKLTANIDYDTILRTLNDIKDFSGHWDAINKVLSFCYDECNRLGPNPKIQNNVLSVTTILKELESKCSPTLSKQLSKICISASDKNVAENDTFNAIKKLDDIVQKHEETFKKHDDEGLKEIKLKIELKSFLFSRLDLLKDMLQYSQNLPLKENLQKYKNDQKFRLLIEMVLADIGNLFDACKAKDVMNKSNMLLREIDLGNVLDHGNPFLDVIANVFDPYDLSMGLLSKAEMLAEHGDSMIQNLP